ncbi:type III-B CRISPR module RAMP protein Cmr1 [Acidianus sp. HS-5]|uniref:type III-B CRISPR module RAMP protein Cmr1 n=1 Tax=Acidianus sp. HS-5 TaxID=2886040 RepID=UPI001F02343B|nr:type III-B CRISPR module RAMP protein Cmr1 [Acidianus sp. HS-5]BDC17371.1 type III-B CRISPR module RAMP protein Cmr1 [Acidianus sp. HS-5]
MEELLLSLKLKALYPLTGGYNKHNINDFYEETVRPTEIKGLWRWWNRVLFNTVTYAKQDKLYTYDSIDRVFEDIFGSENKKSSIRLEVLSEEEEKEFNIEIENDDKIIDFIKNNLHYKKNSIFITILYARDREIKLCLEIGNSWKNSKKIPLFVHIDDRWKSINPEIINRNKLLDFEALEFRKIKLKEKTSNNNVIRFLLYQLVKNYIQELYIKPSIEFVLNIYLDKNRSNDIEFENKLKFTLHSLFVFLLLGGIGRKTSRGFGSLSILNVECYNELCNFIEQNIRNLSQNIAQKGLTNVVRNMIKGYIDTLSNYVISWSNEMERLNCDENNFVYYLHTNDFNANMRIYSVSQEQKLLDIMANIADLISINDRNIKSSSNIEKRAFLLALCGNRKMNISNDLNKELCGIYIKPDYMRLIINSKNRRPSNLRVKILQVAGNYYLIFYILNSNYLKSNIYFINLLKKYFKVSDR